MIYNELDLVILKNILTNKKNALDFVLENDAKLFTAETWNCANVIITYLKTYKSIPTLRILTERLEKTNNAKIIDHIKSVWGQIENITVNDKEYIHDLARLKKRFAEKQLLTIRDNLDKVDPANIDVNRLTIDLQKTVQSIKELNQPKSFERKTLKDALPIFVEEYAAKQNDKDYDKGVYTGYSYLDSVSDGLRDGELLLVGGESGAGKSLLLMNMAIQMWLQNNTIEMEKDFTTGYDILYFSLEMPFKPCRNRVLARLSGNPTKSIRAATLTKEEGDKMKQVMKFINRYPYQFEIVDIPRGATMESLETLYEEAKAIYNPKVVVIDYLGLMDHQDQNLEDWLKLGKISAQMHEFSRVHNCIVLSAVQLNRAKGNSDEDKIGLHRIGRSAMIMQNANIALQINKRANEEKYPDMEYYVIKCRDGELGKGRVLKNFKCGTIIDQKEESTETFQDADDISKQVDKLEGSDF